MREVPSVVAFLFWALVVPQCSCALCCGDLIWSWLLLMYGANVLNCLLVCCCLLGAVIDEHGSCSDSVGSSGDGGRCAASWRKHVFFFPKKVTAHLAALHDGEEPVADVWRLQCLK